MTERELKSPEPTIVSTPCADYAQRQREVLSELVNLSSECVVSERTADEQRDEAQKQAKQRYERSRRRVRRRWEKIEAEATREFEERLASVESRWSLATSEAEYKSSLDRLQSKVENSEQETRQKLKHDLWLADSVYEARSTEIQGYLAKLKNIFDERIGGLKGLGQEIAGQFEQYRFDPPAMEEVLQAADRPGEVTDPEPDFGQRLEVLHRQMGRFAGLFVPGLYVGIRPYLIVAFVVAAAAITGYLWAEQEGLAAEEVVLTTAGVLGGSLALMMLVGWAGRRWARSIVGRAYEPAREALEAAQQAARSAYEQGREEARQQNEAALAQRDRDRAQARQTYQPILEQIAQRRQEQREQIDAWFNEQKATIQKEYEAEKQAVEAERDRVLGGIRERYERRMRLVQERYDRRVQEAEDAAATELAELERRWQAGTQRLWEVIDQTRGLLGQTLLPWDDPRWLAWDGSVAGGQVARFGTVRVNMNLVASEAARTGRYRIELPEDFDLPALLSYPQHGSLVVRHQREGRERALQTVQDVVAGLLTAFEPGRARFTFIDPVGLGENFAGFMYLADYDEEMVGRRIWTDSEHIERRLTDLTEHMENVIQKYLRNEFATIDQYNEQAGELAEPYRFVVIADFPNNFTEEAVRRLQAILASGTRCGVYPLVACDDRAPLPGGMEVEDLPAPAVTLMESAEGFTWWDPVFKRFPLTLDAPPAEQVLSHVVHKAGEAAREAGRVEIPFERTAPTRERYWSGDCTQELRVPIGQSGATRQQELRLGKGVAQHGLIAGKTGSGKSTLLHVLVTNLALWYSPEQVEFYLVDFKKGVEFKTYAAHGLPHARAVAIESDREFGLSVLQRLDAELERRGELFREQGVQSLAEYRQAAPEQVMPRTLLIIDEFQELFAEDDKLAQDAGMLMDRLVRQGRAFGVHALLGSQTISGAGLARSTIGQMAVRIALQCNESDSQLIFDDSNTAARLLSRPGEAIYNDGGGAVEGNSPFQVTWLTEAQRERYLGEVAGMSAERWPGREPTIVFEGSAAAALLENRALGQLLGRSGADEAAREPWAWLGEPITIKDPTGVAFQRRSGANLMVVGQRDDAAMGILGASLVSLAAQHPVEEATFYVLDATPTDSQLAGTMPGLVETLPHAVRLVPWRETEQAMGELAEMLRQRQEGELETPHPPPVFVLIAGLHRYRMLRRKEEDFGFSFREGAEEQTTASPDKQFADLLREGPALGMHTLAWCDTAMSLERTLDRQSMREFDYRVLFQMSSNDSSNLIDSPLANQLGFYRALLYSEEQGITEKFRPYAVLNGSELDRVKGMFDQANPLADRA